MFKLKSFSKGSYTSFALMLGAGLDDGSETDHNTLHIAGFGYSWWFNIPKIISPKRKWVDTSNASWNTDKQKPCGYWDIIDKEYGITFSEDAVHIRYGIQPGSWSRDDPDNSDHTKLFWYPWNFQHVRHDAYSVDGEFLCAGQHWQKYEERWKYINSPRLSGNPHCKHEWVDEEKLNDGVSCAKVKL